MTNLSYKLALVAAFSILLAACTPNPLVDTPQVETLVDDLYGGTGGLSVDNDGNIYSSDFGPFLGQINPNFQIVSKVFKITPQGEVSIYLDSILGASGSVFDREGNFYQSNIRGSYVTKVDSSGETSLYTSDSIVAPVGVAVNDAGELIVCNCGNNTLRKVSADGSSVLFSKGEVFQCPNGITMDREGNYYTANFYNGDVIKITPEGVPSIFATIPGKGNGHLVFRDGFLYVVGRNANQIFKVSMNGEVELFAGTGERGRKNSTRLQSTFSLPNDLEFSPDGKFLYVNEASDSLGSPRILTPTAVRRIRMED